MLCIAPHNSVLLVLLETGSALKHNRDASGDASAHFLRFGRHTKVSSAWRCRLRQQCERKSSITSSAMYRQQCENPRKRQWLAGMATPLTIPPPRPIGRSRFCRRDLPSCVTTRALAVAYTLCCCSEPSLSRARSPAACHDLLPHAHHLIQLLSWQQQGGDNINSIYMHRCCGHG